MPFSEGTYMGVSAERNTYMGVSAERILTVSIS